LQRCVDVIKNRRSGPQDDRPKSQVFVTAVIPEIKRIIEMTANPVVGLGMRGF
jgi:hypothetical protein